MSDISLAKAELRQQILAARKTAYPDHVDLLTVNLNKLVKALTPKRIAIYQSYPSEPKTLDFISTTDVPVLVPITNEDDLTWQELATGAQARIQPGDLMLIPALAIDQQGNRLGRGKGYFDKTLAELPADVLVYAVIFEREFLEALPVEDHDRKVNGVISEVSIREIN